MGQTTNTCIIYDKIQYSSDVLADVSGSWINLNMKLTCLADNLEKISSDHDNVLKGSISYLDDAVLNIKDEYSMMERMSIDLLNVIYTFNNAEGKVDSDKLVKVIQASDFVDDTIKDIIKDGNIKTYYSKEAFEKNITDEELKVLEQTKEKMRELTASDVSSNFATENNFLTFGATSSFATSFALTTLPINSKTPSEFLSGINGPYSEQGLKELLMENYPYLPEDVAKKIVEEHRGEKTSQVKDISAEKESDVLKEPKNSTSANTSSNSYVSYRKTTSNSNNLLSGDSFSNSNNSNVNINDQSSNNLFEDNKSESLKESTVKNESIDKVENNSLEQTPNNNISSKTEVTQEAEVLDEKPGSNFNDNKPIKINTTKPSILSQVSTDLKTSIIGGVDDGKASLDLQTDELSNFTPLSSDSKPSAIDDMLTYSAIVPDESVSTNSSSIAPIAIGLGLAGTTSVAANKIIKKKEKKQEDIINNFFDKDKSDRRFIPLDAVSDDDLNNSSELDKMSQEDEITSSVEKEKTPEEWYDYIKELY